MKVSYSNPYKDKMLQYDTNSIMHSPQSNILLFPLINGRVMFDFFRFLLKANFIFVYFLMKLSF